MPEKVLKVGLVTSYGLRWRLSETEWVPSDVSRNRLRLIGERGPASRRRVANFYKSLGFYVLLDRGMPVYFGIAPKGGLGQRIHDHLKDGLQGKWDEFSWFAYSNLEPNSKGVETPKKETRSALSQKRSVGDFEHVVRISLRVKGGPFLALMKGKPGFKAGARNILWQQVNRAEVRELLRRQKERAKG
ncbi:MAG: hypothetical protein ACYDAL_16600 [Candidatus Dormibacteraceae bacterium]